MEKQLSIAAFWIGVISTVLAVILRGLAVLGVFIFSTTPPTVGSKIPISYRTFLDGAILFFTMAIASSVIAWTKAQKA